MRARVLTIAVSGLLAFASVSAAQSIELLPLARELDPPAAAAPAQGGKAVTGNVSFGLGLTSGNKDTTNFNGSYDVTVHTAPLNVLKSTGLFLYARQDGVLSSEQYGLAVRDEYSLSARAFAFGEVRYLHDRFKGIDTLVAPTVGGGYKVVDNAKTTLSLLGGLGGAWEKDYGVDLRTTGAVSFEERLGCKLSAAASVGQSVSALWNVSDFGDALYLMGVNVTSTLVGKAQLKVEALDTYKTRPPLPTLQSNDFALLTGIVFKF